jgi:hypothetical protein
MVGKVNVINVDQKGHFYQTISGAKLLDRHHRCTCDPSKGEPKGFLLLTWKEWGFQTVIVDSNVGPKCLVLGAFNRQQNIFRN